MNYFILYAACVIGWLLPELFVALGGGKGRFPPFANWLCSSAVGAIALHYYF